MPWDRLGSVTFKKGSKCFWFKWKKRRKKEQKKKTKNYYALLVCKDILVFILNWFNLMGWNHTILNVSPQITYFEEKKNFNCQA